MSRDHASNTLSGAAWGDVLRQSAVRLAPKYQLRNPVMFVVFVGAAVTSVLAVFNPAGSGEATWFIAAISVWLWITVLFANLAEAVAEGRGKAQAATLKTARKDTAAKKVIELQGLKQLQFVSSALLQPGDIVRVDAGDFIPSDGEVIAGVASVDESAITGESAPVIRESGGDCSAVTGGTRVLSDWLEVKITAKQGETFLDRMIALVEGAKRQKTPNEIALSILLAALTIVFLLATATLLPFSIFAVNEAGKGSIVSITVLIALLVCLAPTTIGGLLSAIGIAGMDRLIRANVVAKSGRAVEAAGDVNVLLLDKTGTITYGNRQAVMFYPVPGVSDEELAVAAELASLADETPEGKSIVALARSKFGVADRTAADVGGTFIPFSAETRVSGITLPDRQILKGAGDAIAAQLAKTGALLADAAKVQADQIARQGGTPLIVVENNRTLGSGPIKV